MRCVVTTCRNYQGAGKKSITFHCFPKDYLRVKAWLEASGDYYNDIDAVINFILKSKEGRDLRICSEHFTPDCFYTTDTNKRFLYAGAVPLIFLKAHWVSRVLEIRYNKAASSADASEPGSCTSFAVDATQAASAASGSGGAALFKDHDYTSNFRYKLTSSKFCSTGTQTIIETANKSVATKKCLSRRTISTQTEWSRPRNAATSTHDFFKKMDVWTWTGVFEDKAETARPDVDRRISDKEALRSGESPMETARPDGTPDTAPPTRSSRRAVREAFPVMPQIPLVRTESVAETAVRGSPLLDADHGQTSIAQPREEDYVSEKKFIVFESCLDVLLRAFKKCNYHLGCDAPITEREKSISGSLLTIYTKCEANHRCLAWRSQPMIGRRPCGNILASAAVLLSGSHFTKVGDFFKLLGVPFISESVHYIDQKKFIFPVINAFHAGDRKTVLKHLKDKALCLSGDGWCDGPGSSAKYCTYTLFDEETKKIIDFCIIQGSEASSSMGLERKAFRRCMDRLIGEGLQIGMVSTDRHAGIQEVMKENYSTVKHQFDVWRYCKYLQNKLVSISKSVPFRELSPWTSAIVNHLRMTCCVCRGDVEQLRERWRSVLRHISNEHTWESDGALKSCDHLPVLESEGRRRGWIAKDTQPHLKLTEFVTDARLDRDLPRLADFCHNDELEDYHGTVVNYCPTGVHFTMECMAARTKLAVLAHNALRRKPAPVQCRYQGSGGVGPPSHAPPFSKRRKKWHGNETPVKESELPDHLFSMLADVLRLSSKELEVTWMPKGTFLPPNLYTPWPH